MLGVHPYLLKVSVSADSTETVSVIIVSVDDNSASVSGNLDTVANDLDASMDHNFNSSNEFFGDRVTNHFWELNHDFIIDQNLEISLAETKEGSQRLDNNFCFSSKKNGDGLPLSVNILDEDSHWIFSSTVFCEEVSTSWSDFLSEIERRVVKG